MSKPQFYLVVLWIASAIVLLAVIRAAKLSIKQDKPWEERQFYCLESVILDAFAIMFGTLAAIIEFIEGYYVLFIGSLMQIVTVLSGAIFMIRAYIICKGAANRWKKLNSSET